MIYDESLHLLKVYESDQLVSKVRLQYVLVSSGETGLEVR